MDEREHEKVDHETPTYEAPCIEESARFESLRLSCNLTTPETCGAGPYTSES